MVYCFGGTLGPSSRPGGCTLVAGGMRPKAEWLEATARAWNRQPTPFVWGGKRQQRRERARLRRLGGSGAAFVKGYSIAA